MARRRLLTILAASAVLTGAFAGPATALDLVEDTGTGELVAEVDEATGQVSEAVEAVVEDTAVEEPVAQVAETVEEVVEEVSGPTPSPEPQPERRVVATTPTGDAGDTDARTGADVVAAGDVVDAPTPAVMAGGTGLWAQPDGRPPAAPVAAPAEPTTDGVEAPMVAPAPASSAPDSAMLAQPATTPLPDEESPALALVALVSLVAAGAWTVREARASAAVHATAAVTA